MKVTSSIKVIFDSNDYPNYELDEMGLIDDDGNLLKDEMIKWAEDSLMEIIDDCVKNNDYAIDTVIE